MRPLWRWVMAVVQALGLSLLLGGPASAHVASNGFLAVRTADQQIDGSLELAIRDVELAVGVDTNGDARVTWGELRASEPLLRQYVASHLQFAVQGVRCELAFQPMQVNEHVDGNYAWLPFHARCPSTIGQLTIGYSLLQDIDPSHRGLLTLGAGSDVQVAVLGGRGGSDTFAVGAHSRWRTFVDYLQAGIWHIWSGIDHLLFLLSLLLPAVLVRKDGHWEPVRQVRPALLSIVGVVTAFTLAHSITLSLAALGVVRLPTRLTESIIAASIVVAALNNIVPVVTRSRARIAFSFGLLHGFGFASTLSDMGLPHGARVLSLFSFNLGIECGQLAVVLALAPVIYAMRTAVVYRRVVMPWGSAAIALLAFAWLIQRAVF